MTNDYQSDIAATRIEQLARVRTAVSVPVRWDGQLRGALSVGFHQLRRIRREDVLLLEAIADLAATACQNAAAYEQATAAAATDSLTGVLNHGAMQGRATEEIERARRSGGAVSLVVLDLDDFKALNDTYGHVAGDRFLRRAAAALDLASRPYDTLARYGGDEFVLVLPGAVAEQAVRVAERLRAAVRATTAELGLSDRGRRLGRRGRVVRAAHVGRAVRAGRPRPAAGQAPRQGQRRAGRPRDRRGARPARVSTPPRPPSSSASSGRAWPPPTTRAGRCATCRTWSAARSTSKTPRCSTPATCARRAGARAATTSGLARAAR